MLSTKTGSILFHKTTKAFDDCGNDVHNIMNAELYSNHEIAETELNSNFDYLEDYEIWDIKITYETV